MAARFYVSGVVQGVGYKVNNSLKAKDLQLITLIPNLPTDVVTPRQHNKFRKENPQGKVFKMKRRKKYA